MKKIEQRAVFCLILAGILALGLAVFVFRWCRDGGSWASAAFNRHMYNTSGQLISGTVLDRDGTVLSYVADDGSRAYCDGKTLRKSTLHVVGDPSGNIGTGALSAFADRLTGYNLFNGSYGAEYGNNLYLTINSKWNETAYKALNGRKGTVAVYNYKTGEILCLVSSPSFDPRNIPDDLLTNDAYQGAYLNRFFSSTFTPGSIMKTVTLAAALENISGLEDKTWTCEGTYQLGDDVITCPSVHGTQNIYGALANSCNIVFAQLTVELGANTMEKYTKKAGLMDTYSIDGIHNVAGTFDFKGATDNQLGWAGVGQYHDELNPCSMMVYMGAIANGGRAAVPRLISKVTTSFGLRVSMEIPRKTGRLIASETAQKLAAMMANNVTATYGASRFPNMDLCAKSGTAEVGADLTPHSWFVGFLRNEDAPLAFVVLVENGGAGAKVAGNVASTVLNAIVNG